MKTFTIVVLLAVLLMSCHGFNFRPGHAQHAPALARQAGERAWTAFSRARNRTRQASGISDLLAMRQRLSDMNAD